ncbi:helix-hairpin-helix domain-containing protein [Halomicrobium urmianum]|uniref:helix-hairpin-helix domain-containing protein n=1 Tax=Halomicrobium urmianum TaxID=1586233 RepID=UPI001CD93637|nr:helix-hairpin-helix domain-containing protein [Halomicrobium urmianum]
MGLLEKLKAALGLDGERSAGSGGSSTGDTGVTVEREPSTESENAVKGTEAGASGSTVGTSSETGDEPTAAPATGSVGAETDSDAGSAGSGADIVQEGESDAAADTDDGSETDAEPESTAGTEFVDEAEPESEDEEESESESEAEPESDADEASDSPPVTEINGIGPAYGDRLNNVGVETVAELAAADAAELASQTDLSETRISGWIEQAEEF